MANDDPDPQQPQPPRNPATPRPDEAGRCEAGPEAANVKP
jgi:hypothetical protein